MICVYIYISYITCIIYYTVYKKFILLSSVCIEHQRVPGVFLLADIL